MLTRRSLRCNGRSLVTGGSIPRFCRFRLPNHDLVRIHTRYNNSLLSFMPFHINTLSIERLRKLDQHQGFVKGVCWDPVGEFLATCSDDRSVKIWRTTDWQMEAEVKKPFEDSPGSTFFRRLRYANTPQPLRARLTIRLAGHPTAPT